MSIYMIVDVDGICNGCTVHRNKLGSGWSNWVWTFPQSSSQDKRWSTGGRWAQKYLKNRKKSNAYFGKSLVRLACNQEKNKDKSEKWKQKENNKKKKQLKVPTEELNSHYKMAHIITWHVAAAAKRNGVHAVLWRQKSIKIKGRKLWLKTEETDEDEMRR